MEYWVDTYVVDQFLQHHLLKWVHSLPTHLMNQKNMLNSQIIRGTTCMCVRQNNIMQNRWGWHLREHNFALKLEVFNMQ